MAGKVSLKSVLPVLFFLLITTLLGLSAVAWRTNSNFYLPVPTVIAILTTLLPIINYFALNSIFSKPPSKSLSHNGNSKAPSVAARFRKFANALKLNSLPAVILLYIILITADVVIVTLSSGYVNSSCGLEERWDMFWKSKDKNSVNEIQTQLQCCGFHTSVDRPFPFPAKNVPLDTCQKLLGSTVSCANRWQNKMTVVGGLLITVGLMLFLIKVGMLVALAGRRDAGDEFVRRFGRERVVEEEIDGEEEGIRGRLIEPYRDEEAVNEGGAMLAIGREEDLVGVDTVNGREEDLVGVRRAEPSTHNEWRED